MSMIPDSKVWEFLGSMAKIRLSGAREFTSRTTQQYYPQVNQIRRNTAPKTTGKTRRAHRAIRSARAALFCPTR